MLFELAGVWVRTPQLIFVCLRTPHVSTTSEETTCPEGLVRGCLLGITFLDDLLNSGRLLRCLRPPFLFQVDILGATCAGVVVRSLSDVGLGLELRWYVTLSGGAESHRSFRLSFS